MVEVVLVKGDYFVLECEAYSSSSIATSLEWQGEGGRRVVEDERVNLLPGGGLLVGEAQVNDSGSYSCVATNEHGSSTASSQVTVLSKQRVLTVVCQ